MHAWCIRQDASTEKDAYANSRCDVCGCVGLGCSRDGRLLLLDAVSIAEFWRTPLEAGWTDERARTSTVILLLPPLCHHAPHLDLLYSSPFRYFSVILLSALCQLAVSLAVLSLAAMLELRVLRLLLVFLVIARVEQGLSVPTQAPMEISPTPASTSAPAIAQESRA